MSDPEKPYKNEHAAALASLGASKGGIARAEKLSSERKREIAAKAAQARWGERPAKATHIGTIKLGDMELDCAVLHDGRRVLSQRGVNRALGRKHGGQSFRASQEAAERGGELPIFLAPKGLEPFISDDLRAVASKPIPYVHGRAGRAKGIDATALPMICDAWLRARDAQALKKAQLPAAAAADMIVRGLARIGIIALVDEATGYQEIRDRKALQEILDKYLLREFAKWAKRFPDEFYKEIFRLRGWQWNGLRARRPQSIAYYTKDIVYARLAPGILSELEARNPVTESGRRRAKHHQLLTEEVGHPALAQHLHAVMGLMRASRTWDSFMRLLDVAFPRCGETVQMAFMADPIPEEDAHT
jgi:hypothetical protein